MSAGETPSALARTDRKTVAASVECSATSERAVSVALAARVPGESRWRRTSRARRSAIPIRSSRAVLAS